MIADMLREWLGVRAAPEVRLIEGAETKGVEITSPVSGDYAEAVLAGMDDVSPLSRMLADPSVAFRVGVVLSCCRVIGEGVAQLPVLLYRVREGRGRQLATDHPVYDLLSGAPNSWMTPFDWIETMTMHAVLAGNGYSYISRIGDRIDELVPLVPARMTVEQSSSMELTYRYRLPDGHDTLFQAGDIFHLRGPSWDGVRGIEVVRIAAEAIGLAAATEQSQSKLHANGTRPSGILTTDARLTDDAIVRLKNAWQGSFGGAANSFKTVVLDNGMKWMPMSMTGVDSQHLDTRKFQAEEICRFMRVFPQLVMMEGRGNLASTEQFFLAHVVHCLTPWVQRWEQTIGLSLLTQRERAHGLQARFDLTSMLRGDSGARATYYSRGILDGWLTRNEARAAENMDPLPGLDLPLVPLNMGDGTKPPAPQPDPGAAGPGSTGGGGKLPAQGAQEGKDP